PAVTRRRPTCPICAGTPPGRANYHFELRSCSDAGWSSTRARSASSGTELQTRTRLARPAADLTSRDPSWHRPLFCGVVAVDEGHELWGYAALLWVNFSSGEVLVHGELVNLRWPPCNACSGHPRSDA